MSSLYENYNTIDGVFQKVEKDGVIKRRKRKQLILFFCLFLIFCRMHKRYLYWKRADNFRMWNVQGKCLISMEVLGNSDILPHTMSYDIYNQSYLYHKCKQMCHVWNRRPHPQMRVYNIGFRYHMTLHEVSKCAELPNASLNIKFTLEMSHPKIIGSFPSVRILFVN